MKIIYDQIQDPYFNMALEEYLLTESGEEFIVLWRNSPCVVIGKNQNTVDEIHQEFVEKNHIPVVRRLTGGGAVAHDLGNLNFTVIKNQCPGEKISFEEFTGPVCAFLKDMGIPAQTNGRNDIVVGEYKVSGNAQTIKNGRILHHGTLLFSADISMISNALKPNPVKYESKGVGSVRSRVANIAGFMKDPITVEEFMERLSAYFAALNPDAVVYALTEEDIRRTKELEREKYRSFEWNYGMSPKYNFSKCIRTGCGTVEVRLQIVQGMIDELALYGDFFGKREKSELENRLKGIRYAKEDLTKAVKKINLDEYISGMTEKDFMGLLI